MYIIDQPHYTLSVVASKPDQYTDRSHIVVYQSFDGKPKEKKTELLLDQTELASLIEYLKAHYIKVEHNLFFKDSNQVPLSQSDLFD